MRVLVADPSATRRGILSQAARRAGAQDVVRAASAEEALAACEAPFELAVVARELGPGADWHWLEELREKACPAGRLLVTGTRVTRSEATSLHALGAGAFLLRPCSPEAIADRLRRLLDAPAVEVVEAARDEGGAVTGEDEGLREAA